VPKYTNENLVPPDNVNLKQIRPFGSGEYIANPDGSMSTERTMTFNIEGQEVLAPSLWMTPNGPVDLSRNPDTIVRAIIEYERRTGKKFPRFKTPEEAKQFAIGRSQSGGRGAGELTK